MLQEHAAWLLMGFQLGELEDTCCKPSKEKSSVGVKY